MKKILFLCDHLARTGYGIVSEQIVARLIDYFGDKIAIHIVAINYFGEPVKMATGIAGQSENAVINVYIESGKLSQDKERTPEHMEQDNFGRMVFIERLAQIDFDGIFILQDLGIIQPIIPILKGIKEAKKTTNRKQFKSIFYFPVDGEIHPKYYKDLEFFDLLVTYTEFGRGQLLKHRPELQPKVKVVPHGTDTNDFFCFNELNGVGNRHAFRKEYFGDNSKKFIISNINRNQPRKDIPTTIFGFIEAKKIWGDLKHWKEPFLYLHMHPCDPLGNDLKCLLEQTDLIEGVDYMFPKTDSDVFQVDTPTLNKIYNASDCYVTTTRGEGWGLSVTEAMATGLPVIIPNHTSLAEIGANGRALFLSEFNSVCDLQDNIIRDKCNEFEVAERIIDVANMKYVDYHRLDLITQNALEWVRGLSWENICKRWVDYFKEVY